MTKLPIDVVPSRSHLIFRWQWTTDTPIGPKTIDCEGALTGSAERAVLELIRHARVLEEQRDKLMEQCDELQAFKQWVHAYLDAHGVPHHPEGTHGAAGCRIGDRMDWLMAQLDEASKRANVAEVLCSDQKQAMATTAALVVTKSQPSKRR